MKWAVIGLSAVGLVAIALAAWLVHGSPDVPQVQPVVQSAPAEPTAAVAPEPPREQPVPAVTWSQVLAGDKPEPPKQSQSGKPLQWQERKGKCYADSALDGILVYPVLGAMEMAPTIDVATGREVLGMIQPRAYDKLGDPFVLRHYPKTIRKVDGEWVKVKAVRVGSSTYNDKTIEIWDCEP